MDNLQPLKSFLTDLITPIVKSAVGEAMPEAVKPSEDGLVPVKEISKAYGISVSKLYNMFRSGELEKHKIGNNTFVRRCDLEACARGEKMCGKVPMKRK